MKQIHLDITILEDINAFNHNESGNQLLELIEYYIQKKYLIIVELKPVNFHPENITILVKGDSFNKFFNNWSNLFKK